MSEQHQTPIRIAMIGVGKITVDQHIPAVRNNSAFELVAGVSPNSRAPDLRVYNSVDELLAQEEVDAVAVNTPPQVRFAIARQAIEAGKHVLLEKPPTGTIGELRDLEALAAKAGTTLFTAWHSQHAPGVKPAREWLAGRTVKSVEVRWCEDVRRWHPGQTWIWQAGGMGVFDPAINALSILTAILPAPLRITEASLEVPSNCQSPSAADLRGGVGQDGEFHATLDFFQTGPQTWSIDIETDRGSLAIKMGGAELSLDNVAQDVGDEGEYPTLYARFAELVNDGRSEVDALPLSLVADTFMIGERKSVDAFIE